MRQIAGSIVRVKHAQPKLLMHLVQSPMPCLILAIIDIICLDLTFFNYLWLIFEILALYFREIGLLRRLCQRGISTR